MKKIFLLAIAAFAIISCDKMNSAIDNDFNDNDNVVTIKAIAPETKTQLVDGSEVHWSANDVIKVCFPPIRNWSGHSGSTRYGYSSDFTSTNNSLSSTTVFKGEWTWSSSNQNKIESIGFAIYPGNSSNFSYSADATTSSGAIPKISISFTIPEEQEAIESTFEDELNLSSAPINRADMYSNTATATFKSLCSIFAITLPSTEYNIKSIKLEIDNNSNNTHLTGHSTFTYDNSNGLLTENKLENSGEPTYVTLKKKDGSNLIPGETYYAVVWGHNYKGIKLTFTNVDGKVCTKVASKDSWIDCEASKKYSFNISSLSFDAAPFLDVATTSITANKQGGTESFIVNANNDVTVSIPGSVGWITGSYSNGQCTLEIKPNKESSSRSATITLSSAGLSRNVTITQPNITYSLSGSALTKASDLTNGQMYVVRRQAVVNEYWSVNSNGILVDVNVDNTSNFTSQQVFIFNKDDSKAAGVSCGSGYSDKYSYMSAGAWQSAWNDQYLHHNFYLQSDKYYFSMYSGWKENSLSLKTGEDFDIYKANDSKMVNWNGSDFSWGNLGTDKYKWTFYKVVEN